MKLNIELGENLDGPVMAMPKSDPKMHYPQLHITSKKEIPFPKEGTMVIHYKKIGSSEHGQGDDMRYSCDLEVHKIISVEGEKQPNAPSKRDKSAEDSLDALAAEKSKQKDY